MKSGRSPADNQHMEAWSSMSVKERFVRGTALALLALLILNTGCGWRPKVNGFTEGGLQRDF